MSLSNVVSNNIKYLRESKKWTQKDLAQMLNISEQGVSKWERGESIPEISKLVDISKIFNVSTDDLLKTVLSSTSLVDGIFDIVIDQKFFTHENIKKIIEELKDKNYDSVITDSKEVIISNIGSQAVYTDDGWGYDELSGMEPAEKGTVFGLKNLYKTFGDLGFRFIPQNDANTHYKNISKFSFTKESQFFIDLISRFEKSLSRGQVVEIILDKSAIDFGQLTDGSRYINYYCEEEIDQLLFDKYVSKEIIYYLVEKWDVAPSKVEESLKKNFFRDIVLTSFVFNPSNFSEAKTLLDLIDIENSSSLSSLKLKNGSDKKRILDRGMRQEFSIKEDLISELWNEIFPKEITYSFGDISYSSLERVVIPVFKERVLDISYRLISNEFEGLLSKDILDFGFKKLSTELRPNTKDGYMLQRTPESLFGSISGGYGNEGYKKFKMRASDDSIVKILKCVVRVALGK